MSSLRFSWLAFAFYLAVTSFAENKLPREVEVLQRLGYGALAKGGDGGEVIWVTNLNDSGPGSLRAALASRKPRVVKFKVGGTVQLKDRLLVQSGRVTIDGLSAAPRGGITVQGGLAFSKCEDVIVRHVRSRGGYDTMGLYGCRRVLIDHVSTRAGRLTRTPTYGAAMR